LQGRVGDDEGFAEEGATFGATDIEGIAEAGEVGEREGVGGRGEAIGKAGTIEIERDAIETADGGDGGEFGEGVDGAILGGVRDIDHAGLDGVFEVGVVFVGEDGCLDALGGELA